MHKPLIPDWRSTENRRKQRLIQAGKDLNRIVRHSGPKPRPRGFWLAPDGGGWIMIEDLLRGVKSLGDFHGLNYDEVCVGLILDIVALECHTKKGRFQICVEVFRGGWGLHAEHAVPDDPAALEEFLIVQSAF